MTKKLLLALSLICLQLLLTAAEPVSFLIELDGRHSKNIFSIDKMETFINQSNNPNYFNLTSKAALTPQWQEYQVKFTPSHNGTVILGIRCNSRDRDCRMDVDAVKLTGAVKDIFNGSFELQTKAKEAAWWRYYIEANYIKDAKDAADGKAYMRITRSYGARQGFSVKAGVPVTLTFKARSVQSTKTIYNKWSSSSAAAGK